MNHIGLLSQGTGVGVGMGGVWWGALGYPGRVGYGAWVMVVGYPYGWGSGVNLPQYWVINLNTGQNYPNTGKLTSIQGRITSIQGYLPQYWVYLPLN